MGAWSFSLVFVLSGFVEEEVEVNVEAFVSPVIVCFGVGKAYMGVNSNLFLVGSYTE